MTGNVSQLGPEAPIVAEDGFAFRDLNKNGWLDPYEDSRRPVDERVEDLPYDSVDPLFPFGYGLTYQDTPKE
jgi:hypothetical protein